MNTMIVDGVKLPLNIEGAEALDMNEVMNVTRIGLSKLATLVSVTSGEAERWKQLKEAFGFCHKQVREFFSAGTESATRVVIGAKYSVTSGGVTTSASMRASGLTSGALDLRARSDFHRDASILKGFLGTGELFSPVRTQAMLTLTDKEGGLSVGKAIPIIIAQWSGAVPLSVYDGGKIDRKKLRSLLEGIERGTREMPMTPEQAAAVSDEMEAYLADPQNARQDYSEEPLIAHEGEPAAESTEQPKKRGRRASAA